MWHLLLGSAFTLSPSAAGAAIALRVCMTRRMTTFAALLTMLAVTLGVTLPSRAQTPAASNRPVDASVATRLKNVMVPLITHMNRPIPLNQVEVGLMDDGAINAANAGG